MEEIGLSDILALDESEFDGLEVVLVLEGKLFDIFLRLEVWFEDVILGLDLWLGIITLAVEDEVFEEILSHDEGIQELELWWDDLFDVGDIDFLWDFE